MKPSGTNYRVAVTGASSLLGKELLGVLQQRNFPVSRLVTLASENEPPEAPILDLNESYPDALAAEEISARDIDLAFLVARRGSGGNGSSFLAQLERATPGQCAVIDVAGALSDRAGRVLSIPFLDRNEALGGLSRLLPAAPPAQFLASAHPATIMISSLLLKVAARVPVKTAVAQIFVPASEIGASAVEELQKQTVSLLSFQKVPREIFGAQLAFNLLPRLGRGEETTGPDLDHRVRSELNAYLGARVPLPAVRLFHVPVFYSLGLSLYLETAEPTPTETLRQALEGDRLRLHRASQHAPSQVEAAGSSDILVDAIAPDPDHPSGVWIWAVTDNICLAAVNAVEIAESLKDHDK